MNKSKIATFIILSGMIILTVSAFQINLFKNKQVSNIDEASWSEVPIKKGSSISKCTGVKDFDLKKHITDAEYIFSGEIIEQKEYEVKWTDKKGEQWGPFPSSVLKVRIKNKYFGSGFEKKKEINVYYPYSLSTTFEGSFSLKNKHEYIFVTKKLDEKFVKKREKNAPNDKFGQEKYADVYISEPYFSIMDIENNTVLMNSDYFCWNEDIMNKGKKVRTNDEEINKLVESGWVIGLEKDEFKKELEEMIVNKEKLPDAKEIRKIKEGNVENNS